MDSSGPLKVRNNFRHEERLRRFSLLRFSLSFLHTYTSRTGMDGSLGRPAGSMAWMDRPLEPDLVASTTGRETTTSTHRRNTQESSSSSSSSGNSSWRLFLSWRTPRGNLTFAPTHIRLSRSSLEFFRIPIRSRRGVVAMLFAAKAEFRHT